MEPADEIEIVSQSYKRCVEVADFFDKFYDNFIKKSPEIAERFINTNMAKQMEALKHSLQYMIMYASGSKIAHSKIEDLGQTHDRNHRNITPNLYDAWITSLVETVKECDPQFNDNIGMGWRNTMGYGIRKMQSMY